MDCKAIGDRIKSRKEALHITTNDLCERSGVPVDTINNIIYARVSNPSIDSLGSIAMALETTLDYLVYGNCPNPQTEEKHHRDHKCCFDAERYIQSMIDVHRREMDAQCKAKDELIVELRKELKTWRKIGFSLAGILGTIIVWFVWDVLNPDLGLIQRIRSMITGRNIG